MSDISQITYKNYSLGELNSYNRQLFKSRYDPTMSDRSLFSKFVDIFKKEYEYDTSSGTGPYLAVVLKVLSGPNAGNDASTGGYNSKTLIIDDLPSPDLEATVSQGRPTSTRVIAKIPEFDADIDWPEDNQDEMRIAAHNEFHQRGSGANLEGIGPGALIWVTFSNEEQGGDGKPTGYIVGVHNPALFSPPKVSVAPQKAFNPDCPSPVTKGPDTPLYVGQTADEMIAIPPIRKIKGKIKTGIYGNGTAQTKHHFEAALIKSDVSLFHKIKGPTPGPNNAFIWVGHLKHNGYMDLLDRPLSPGRETIIYAPKMLDLTAPIEIKYYFHDEVGFGSAWIDGPLTTVEQSINSVGPGNDFKQKIAPAIKDLIRDGRNCILVIPEMMYSRGFGTSLGDVERVAAMSTGDSPPGNGIPTHLIRPTIRTSPEAAENTEAIPAIKAYLNNLNIESDRDVLSVTRMRERQFSTFDGSFTGGNFKLFHEEVLDVLDSHLGPMRDSVGFISLVADGMGAITLAAMVKSNPFSAVHTSARAKFNTLKINKIDYINRPNDLGGIDNDGYYLFMKTPSYSIFNDYLLTKSQILGSYLEFNYISSAEEKTSTKKFFSLIGHEEKFNQSWTTSITKPGKKAFSVHTQEEALSKNFINLHLVPDSAKVGYAIANRIDPLLSDGAAAIPTTADSVLGKVPGSSIIPDHAGAVSSKKGIAQIAVLQKEADGHQPNINQTEEVLNIVMQDLDGDITNLCTHLTWNYSDDPNAEKITDSYCSDDGVFQYSSDSVFGGLYKEYLKSKMRFIQVTNEIYGEQEQERFLINYGKFKKIVEDKIKELKEALSLIKNDDDEQLWKEMLKGFNPSEWTIEANMFEVINSTAFSVSKKDLIKKFINKLEVRLQEGEDLITDVKIKCLPQPKPLKEPEPKKIPKKLIISPPVTTCGVGGMDRAPKDYNILYNSIPWAPSKKDFEASKKPGKVGTHGRGYPTSLWTEVEDFKMEKVKYKVRRVVRANDQVIVSKKFSIWACIADRVQQAMAEASQESGYYPITVTNSIRGCEDCPPVPNTSNKYGISLHTMGLAFDIDPFFNAYVTGKRINSLFNGSLMPGLGDNEVLAKLRVYPGTLDQRKENIWMPDPLKRPGKELIRRWHGTWLDGPLAKSSDSGFTHYTSASRSRYNHYVGEAGANHEICPEGSNPLLWAILFCEKSGMFWGNGKFLKNKWKKHEKAQINKIFEEHGISNAIERVKAISWTTSIEDHMHFHFWGGRSMILWHQIDRVRKKRKLK